MYDKPQLQNDTATAVARPLQAAISALTDSDPAEAPAIADEIAARLEADLAAASGRAPVAEAAPEVG